MQYDVIIIGAGPGGIFSAYELSKLCPEKKIAVFEEGQPLEKRKCPIDGKTVKHCVGCPTCAIMNGFGGAGAFSDGKYNLTNDFGGTLYEYIGKKQAMELMHYVDAINVSHGGENTRLYSTANSAFKTRCLQCNLHLLDASVRHLGTDINFVVLKISLPSWNQRSISTSARPYGRCWWRTAAMRSSRTAEAISASSALSPSAAAAASGWRACAAN